jgi:hypothetical protein
MERVACGLFPLMLGFALLASASAAPAVNDWRVLARATDAGDQVAVVAAAKRRAQTFDVRVRVIGEPKTAKLHAVVTCSKRRVGASRSAAAGRDESHHT